LRSPLLFSSDASSQPHLCQLVPVVDKCASGGWVMIRAFDPFHEDLTLESSAKGNYICMNTPRNNSDPDLSPVDEWVVQIRKDRDAVSDFRY
jgi:hypothetical protein